MLYGLAGVGLSVIIYLIILGIRNRRNNIVDIDK